MLNLDSYKRRFPLKQICQNNYLNLPWKKSFLFLCAQVYRCTKLESQLLNLIAPILSRCSMSIQELMCSSATVPDSAVGIWFGSMEIVEMTV